MNRYCAPFIAAFALFAGAANVFADTVSFSATNLTIAPGGQQALYVMLPYAHQAPAGGLTVQLLSTNPLVAEVPASTTIPATSGGIGFYVTGLSVGTTTIIGIAPGSPVILADVTVTSASAPTLAFSSASLTVGAGSQQSLFVITSPVAPPGGISVALSSSNTAAAQVPASISIPTGTTSVGFLVTGVAAGMATITGTASGFSPITSQVTVVPPVTLNTISFNQTNLNVAAGSRQVLFVTLPQGVQAPAGGLTVNLSSSNPLVATVPASITIPGTSNGIGFYVQGLSPGTTTITATAPPSFGPITATVTVN